MRRGGCAEHRRLVLRTGASRWAPPAEPSMYMSAALVPGMFHVKPRDQQGTRSAPFQNGSLEYVLIDQRS